MEKAEKTNAMRILEQKGEKYTPFYLSSIPEDGKAAAEMLQKDPCSVFKTLVTVGSDLGHYVFVIPVAEELNLKKAAAASGEKSIAMVKQKELLPLTGYVHGGCSPVGMKKAFPTWIHETAKQQERMFVSAGKVGFQIELAPADLAGLARCCFADLV